MTHTEPILQTISDTARWAAVFRARESERPDALFRDLMARRLAGERGEQIADTLPYGDRHSWSFVIRTYVIDQLINDQVGQGVDMVINLAAGLDARPYRMVLPPSFQWIEVDLPEIINYKEKVLEGEKPAGNLERVGLDLVNVSARRELFERLSRKASKALIITEGLLPYLSAEEVGSLATDLATPPSFQRWILDLLSPGLVERLQQSLGPYLNHSGASMKFGPEEGPEYFTPYGWNPVKVHSMLTMGARLHRLSFWMRLVASLPEPTGRQGSRPWGGVCLYTKG
ncbi:MAG: SAM-dependent methyltransferase [Acidobacteriia bacterium]|nr:SAM-dependent methyltransferase [Terriglobia bacterium]